MHKEADLLRSLVLKKSPQSEPKQDMATFSTFQKPPSGMDFYLQLSPILTVRAKGARVTKAKESTPQNLPVLLPEGTLAPQSKSQKRRAQAKALQSETLSENR